jgi:hypothetical protein
LSWLDINVKKDGRHDWPFSIYQQKGVRKGKVITTAEDKKVQRKIDIKVGKPVPVLK